MNGATEVKTRVNITSSALITLIVGLLIAAFCRWAFAGFLIGYEWDYYKIFVDSSFLWGEIFTYLSWIIPLICRSFSKKHDFNMFEKQNSKLKTCGQVLNFSLAWATVVFAIILFVLGYKHIGNVTQIEHCVSFQKAYLIIEIILFLYLILFCLHHFINNRLSKADVEKRNIKKELSINSEVML